MGTQHRFQRQGLPQARHLHSKFWLLNGVCGPCEVHGGQGRGSQKSVPHVQTSVVTEVTVELWVFSLQLEHIFLLMDCSDRSHLQFKLKPSY